MRVKGSKKLEGEQVVVAYGAGKFQSSVKGKRGAPVKKLMKKLRQYVTVVPVDEFRTSKVCSNRCLSRSLDTAVEPEEDGTNEEDGEEVMDGLEWTLGEGDGGGGDEEIAEEREREKEEAANSC